MLGLAVQPSPALTVVLSSEDLGCNVVWCSTEGTRGVTWSDPLLREGGGGRQKTWLQLYKTKVIGCARTNGGPVSAPSQYSHCIINNPYTSFQHCGLTQTKSMRVLPCTCRSLWAWCVPRDPRERCPASGLGRWCPFHAGSSGRYRFRQHKICEGEERERERDDGNDELSTRATTRPTIYPRKRFPVRKRLLEIVAEHLLPEDEPFSILSFLDPRWKKHNNGTTDKESPNYCCKNPNMFQLEAAIGDVEPTMATSWIALGSAWTMTHSKKKKSASSHHIFRIPSVANVAVKLLWCANSLG